VWDKGKERKQQGLDGRKGEGERNREGGKERNQTNERTRDGDFCAWAKEEFLYRARVYEALPAAESGKRLPARTLNPSAAGDLEERLACVCRKEKEQRQRKMRAFQRKLSRHNC